MNVDLDCLFFVEQKSPLSTKIFGLKNLQEQYLWASDASLMASWIFFFLPLGGAEDCHRLQGMEYECLFSISEDSGLSAELWETVGPSCLAHAWKSVLQWIKFLDNQVSWLLFSKELHSEFELD